MKKIFYLLLLIPAIIFGQTTKEIVFYSKQLKADRKIWINTPEFYELGKDSLQIIFLLDGNNRSLFDLTVASKRFLEGNSVDLSDYKAPQSIIIGIQQAEDRSQDFVDSVNSLKFLSFLETELFPFVQSNYRTVNYKILIGHSLGARFAINTLLVRPGLFNAIIAASPAFSKKSIDAVLKKFDTLFNSNFLYDKALYFSTTYLKADMTEDNFREFSEKLQSYLEDKPKTNFRFEFNSSNSLGHGKSPYFSVPQGLHFIYEPDLWQLKVSSLFSKAQSANQAATEYQQRVMQKFGISASTSAFTPILADDLIKQNKTSQAIDLYKREVDLRPTELYNFKQFLLLLKKNNNKELFDSYHQKFIITMKQMKLSALDTKDWLQGID